MNRDFSSSLTLSSSFYLSCSTPPSFPFHCLLISSRACYCLAVSRERVLLLTLCFWSLLVGIRYKQLPISYYLLLVCCWLVIESVSRWMESVGGQSSQLVLSGVCSMKHDQ